jgi:hypothetical protein
MANAYSVKVLTVYLADIDGKYNTLPVKYQL